MVAWFKNGRMPLPLVAIPPPRRASLFDAALEARRALCALEAPGAAPSEAEVGAARHRVLAQLASVAECVQGMAATGLLHTDLDAGRTLQTSARQPERDGEWTAETIVTRLPPKAMITAQWSPELCQTVMSAAVVMSVVERDYRSELVEYRELAAMLASSWPEVEPALRARFGAEWARNSEREDGAASPWDPVDASPWGRAVHQVHAQLMARAYGCHAPPEVRAGAIHALDLARRTLQWIGDDVERAPRIR